MTEDRLTELFGRAFELDETERAALLAELRQNDTDLASALERLLAAARDEPWELDRSPWRGLSAEPTSPRPAEAPERIGPYRVVRELGRGGMGRVYLAEEEAEEFQRTIALKVIDRPGPDDESIRRFRTEVKILASLDHPGVARFLAGGRSSDGIWFLALEYVEGEDLIRHAARHGLDVRARLALFLQVLDSVHYAHDRGVVHRDLKPGHLLVGKDGRTRLLDFGISKLLEASGSDGAEASGGSNLTLTEWRAMTPAYASPEQFRGERATPLSDVYSLGVVLYELLAGLRPFDEAGKDPRALERAVLETEPEPPSTAARRSAAEGRNAASRPNLSLSPDLDAICLKAIRKEPKDRYASAAALAADLTRFLEGRPVEARRGGMRYRAGRFVRRHRSRLLTAAALALALAGFSFALLAARDAERLRVLSPPPRAFPFSDIDSRPIAEREREFATVPESVEAGAALALALVRAERQPEAALVLTRLRQIPGRQLDPLVDYADAILAENLNEPQRALVLLTRARDGAALGGRGELLPKTRAARGRLLMSLGESAEGKREMELALADYERIGDHAAMAQVLNDLSVELLQRGDFERGEAMIERTLSEFRAAGKKGLIAIHNLAWVALERGRPDLSEKRLLEAAGLEAAEGRSAHTLHTLAVTRFDLGRPAEARPLIEEAIALARKVHGESDLAVMIFDRARIDLGAGRFDRIDATVLELEDLALASGDKSGLANARLLRGLAAAARDDFELARRELGEGRRLQITNGRLLQAAGTDIERAEVELAAGDGPAALAVLDELSHYVGTGSSAAVLAATLRARLAAETGQIDDARRRFAALGDGDADSPSVRRKLVFLRARAAMAIAEGRIGNAREDFDSAIAAAHAAQWTVAARRLERDRAASGVEQFFKR